MKKHYHIYPFAFAIRCRELVITCRYPLLLRVASGATLINNGAHCQKKNKKNQPTIFVPTRIRKKIIKIPKKGQKNFLPYIIVSGTSLQLEEWAILATHSHFHHQMTSVRLTGQRSECSQGESYFSTFINKFFIFYR